MRCIVSFAFATFTASSLLAAPPQLTAVTPRGWKAGPNEVVVQGANFADAMQLLVDVPGATAEVKPEPKPAANTIAYVVTLPAETPAGLYEAWAATEDGISGPVLLMVDAFPNVAEVEPNNDLPQAQAIPLPAALEGRLGGVESDWFAFDGKAGQRIVAEIAGRRLGCNIKPVLRLYTASRLELASARPDPALGRDARLVATLPADGRYLLELQDLLYRGDGNQYRLLVGDFQAADGLFPLGGKRGAAANVQFSGGTLAQPVTRAAPPAADPFASVIAVPLAMPLASPLPRPFAIGDREEVLEAAAIAASGAQAPPQAVPLGTVVNGRLDAPREQDRYQLAVTAGTRLRIAIHSARLGTPLDGLVQVLNEQGAALATQDDGPGTTDPDFLFTVPANVASIVVAVSDVHGRGGPAFAYRLIVEPSTGGDFDLSLLSPLVNVPAGGSASVRVRAVRREMNEPIRLKVVGDVPAGLLVRGAEIGPGATDTILSLTAPDGAAIKAGTLRVVGEIGPPEKPTLTRAASVAGQPAYEAAPWLRDRLSAAVTRPAPLALSIEPAEPVFIRGSEYKAKVVVKRAEGQAGPVRLAVQTSQSGIPGIAPVNPVQNLLIPENASETELRMPVIINATEMPLAFVVQGQLLDPKNQNVVKGAAETPSVASRVVFPYMPELAGGPFDWKRGVRNVIAGKLTRYGTFKEPVQIQLTGLPATFRTAAITVPPEAGEFQIAVLVPATQPPGAIPNLRLAPNTAAAPLQNQKQPMEVLATVAPDDPPAALEIFSDGEDFTAALTEGSGTAAIESNDKAAGAQSALIKGEKSRVALPGLTVPIAEAPKPGEYRFLRFAWKKRGGQSAVVQLAASNQFARQSAKMTDYRYLAGTLPGGSKSIQAAERPPSEWTVVTRDLFADHGAFTLTGIGFSSVDGEGLLIDHVWLASTEADLPAVEK